jgi:hypothetical protein
MDMQRESGAAAITGAEGRSAPWAARRRSCGWRAGSRTSCARIPVALMSRSPATSPARRTLTTKHVRGRPSRLELSEPGPLAASAPPVCSKVVNASDELLRQRDNDACRASHVAELVPVLVLNHLADELAAVGAQARDSLVDAFDCKHDAPES